MDPEILDCIRSLLEVHHREWTRSLVGTVVRKGHSPDQAVEACQMAFVEFWLKPEVFRPARRGLAPSEDALFRLLRQRAIWRAGDLRRTVCREVPCEDISLVAAQPADPWGGDSDLGDLLLEPDEPFWLAMNTTQHHYGSGCHCEALSRCLAGETQRSVAEAFGMSAPTLNRQLGFFRRRFALLGLPGRPTYDVAQVRLLRRRGCTLVVMLEGEVEGDTSLLPRFRLPDLDSGSVWICEVLCPDKEGEGDG